MRIDDALKDSAERFRTGKGAVKVKQTAIGNERDFHV